MKIEPLNIFQIDINKTYIIDDDLNIFRDTDHFDDYYFHNYIGVKDNYEDWCEVNQAEHKATEISGSEAIAILHQNAIEMGEYNRYRYFQSMDEIKKLKEQIEKLEGEKK